MGRVRGKGKKQRVVTELGIGEEEKIATVKKRGRPQKAVKESSVSESKLEEEEENGEAVKESTTESEENGERKRRSVVKHDELIDEEEEEDVGGAKVMKNNVVVKAVGFRPNGNRRKNNTPRRAAEVGVECQ